MDVDADVFGAANHDPVVIGTAEAGFQIWCPRCDLVGGRIYGSLDAAQRRIALLTKDIAPVCQELARAAQVPR